MNATAPEIRQAFPGLEIGSTTIPHSERVYCVAFSPDGRFLVSGSVNRQVNLWEVGETVLSDYMKGHTKFVWSLDFAPDGKTLASTSGDGNLFIWDLEKRAYCRIEESHYAIVYPLYDVACSPDGKYIAAGCSDTFVRLWSTTSRRPPWKLKGHESEIYAVAFSPDGKILASGGNDATIRFWEMEDKQEIELLHRPGCRISSLDFSPDGRLLAAASTNANIYLIDLGDHSSRTLKGHEGVVWSVAFSPDSRTLISGGNDHTVRLWEVDSGELLQTLEGHLDEVNDVAFSPDGRLAASAGNDRTVRVWDLTPFQERPDRYLHLVHPAANPLDRRLVDFIRGQRRSFSRARTGNDRPQKSIAWLKATLDLTPPPPLGLIHDLGRVFTRPANELPEGLHPGHRLAGTYEALLAELCHSGLPEEIARLELSDRELGLVLGRCLAGLSFQPEIPAPGDRPPARIARLLEATLSESSTTGNDNRKQTENRETADQPGLHDNPESPFLPLPELERLGRRLRSLNGPAIRLLLDLAEGPNTASTADLFSQLPAESLPPELSRLYCEILARAPKTLFKDRHGSQVATAGGYQGLTHKGCLDSLALSEHLYPEKLLRHRILNREALYYGREAERPRRRRFNLVLLQTGLETRGAARELGRALALSLLQKLGNRAEELRFASCDGPWEKLPAPIDRSCLLPRLLGESRERELDLAGFLRTLKTGLEEWSRDFPEIEIVWIIENHFWHDLEENVGLTPIIRKIGRLAGHRAWLFSGSRPSTAPHLPRFIETSTSFYHDNGQLKIK